MTRRARRNSEVYMPRKEELEYTFSKLENKEYSKIEAKELAKLATLFVAYYDELEVSFRPADVCWELESFFEKMSGYGSFWSDVTKHHIFQNGRWQTWYEFGKYDFQFYIRKDGYWNSCDQAMHCYKMRD